MPTLTVIQAPALVTRSDGSHVDQLGDQSFYSAPLLVDGSPRGVLLGEFRTVRVPGADAEGDAVDRLGLATFRFSSVDSIVVAGVVAYEQGSLHSREGAPITRAVIGGTGEFLGARGEVVSVRSSDGAFVHTFTLL